MEDIKRQLMALQTNIDNHVKNGEVGNPCPVCGVSFSELADGLADLVDYEIRKLRTTGPQIDEGEIVEDEE